MLFVRLHLLVLLACEASTAANSIEGISGGLVRVRRVSVLTLYPDLWSRASLAEAASRIPLPPARYSSQSYILRDRSCTHTTPVSAGRLVFTRQCEQRREQFRYVTLQVREKNRKTSSKQSGP